MRVTAKPVANRPLPPSCPRHPRSRAQVRATMRKHQPLRAGRDKKLSLVKPFQGFARFSQSAIVAAAVTPAVCRSQAFSFRALPRPPAQGLHVPSKTIRVRLHCTPEAPEAVSVDTQQHATTSEQNICNRSIEILVRREAEPSERAIGSEVRNLDRNIDNKALYDTFSLFGNILSCKAGALLYYVGVMPIMPIARTT